MRMIDVLSKDEKLAQRRTKKAVAELGGVMVDLDAARSEIKLLYQSKADAERSVAFLREARRNIENDIGRLTNEANGIRLSQKRDPDVAAALESGEDAEGIYARMKPDVYGIAVYQVQNGDYEKWFLKMRWGNTARIIAEGHEDAVCKVAGDILKLIDPQGKPIRAIRVTDKKAIWDTKDY